MTPSSHFLSRISWYLITWTLLWVVGGIFLWIYGYQNSFLILNNLNNPFWDMVMPHLTHLGHGLLVGGILLVISRNMKPLESIALILSLLLLALIVALSKSYLFPDWHRPARIFEISQINFISLAGEKNYSFPSGHSAGAAVSFLFVALSLSGINRFWGIPAALMAGLVAYSRLYIGVHFLGDILAGSFLGIALAMGTMFMLAERKSLVDFTEKHSQKLGRIIKIIAAVLLCVDMYILISQNYL